MGKLIECGERTVQTKDRISIHDIAEKHGIKAGSLVKVNIRAVDGDDHVDKIKQLLDELTINAVEMKQYIRNIENGDLSRKQIMSELELIKCTRECIISKAEFISVLLGE